MANSISGVSSNSLGVPPGGSSASSGDKSEFFNALDSAMKQVDQLQDDASAKVAELLQGNGQDLHSAMIAVEKADLSFQLMMQVRNKIIQAYQTISQLQF
jgi:flagellar hook-basal body complex protein FliE